MVNSQDLIKQLETVLKKHDVVVAYLFGSVVSGSQHADSDIDLAIIPGELLKEETDGLIDNITADISATINMPERRVDVSLLSELPLPLRFNVQREGVPFYVKDELVRREIMLRDAALYHDQYPFIKAANDRFAKSLQ